MINLDEKKPVWFIDKKEIGLAFFEAAKKAYDAIDIADHAPHSRSDSFTRLNRALNNIPLNSLAELLQEDVEKIIVWTFRGEIAKPEELKHELLRNLKTNHISPVVNFFKLCFVQLWIDRKFLAPRKMLIPGFLDLAFDSICINSNSNTLVNIRKVNEKSSIPYHSALDLQERERKSSHWMRLLLGTTFYNVQNVTEEDCRFILINTFGKSGLPFSGNYSSVDFLFTLTSNHEKKRIMIDELVKNFVPKNTNAKKTDEPKAPKIPRETVTERNAKPVIIPTLNILLDFANANSSLSVDDFIRNCLVTEKNQVTGQRQLIGKTLNIYAMGDFNTESHPFYSKLPKQVQLLVKIVNSTFLGFIKSKRAQNEKTHYTMYRCFLSYISSYLPNFYANQYGNLSKFPTSLNEFSCTIFVTRSAIFHDDSMISDEPLPLTFLTFFENISKICSYKNNSLYGKVSIIDEYFKYLVANKVHLKDADKIQNTFSPACYPKVTKSSGTVKKTIPRSYFSTYLNMLYALEYLVTHLNGMAEGENSAIINQKLYKPTYTELVEHHKWNNIWGKGIGQSANLIDLSLLNYTPIFYYQGKAYPFKYIPRFFRMTEYEFDHKKVLRISPNDIRILILMCETGIRQHHIVWLDQDSYDSAIDKSIKSPLAPLWVNTDKAHGGWVSIISSHLFPLMERQKQWNQLCTLPEYKEKIWYGFKEGSKFGKINPLFRLPVSADDIDDGSDQNWKAFPSFRDTLLCLQYAINTQLGDNSIDNLVYYKENNDTPVKPLPSYEITFLSKMTRKQTKSDLTPHGLRAAFVSDAVRFLPASIVGQFFTGQTEQLVLYYKLFDGLDTPNHSELLAQLLSDNMNKLSKGEAPELAATVLKINAGLMAAIEKNPQKAIEDYRLMSLSGIEDKNGIDLLKAKRATKLAYNNTHICPFNNQCPKEVIEHYGYHACGICPFAIRGVAHLPAISAEKDKAKENVAGILEKLEQYKKLNPSAVNKENIEELNKEYDFAIREAYCLEAVEQQLYSMAKAGNKDEFFLQNKAELINFYEKVELTEGEYLIKRLIDVQNFPDVTSSKLDTKFAYLRGILLLKKGKIRELLKINNDTTASSVSSLIASMINAGELTTQQLFKISNMATSPIELDSPESDIRKLLGFKE